MFPGRMSIGQGHGESIVISMKFINQVVSTKSIYIYERLAVGRSQNFMNSLIFVDHPEVRPHYVLLLFVCDSLVNLTSMPLL